MANSTDSNNLDKKNTMKYKLVNQKTGETHLCEKVSIKGFDYYVSDESPYPNDVVHSSVANAIVRFTDPRYFSEGTYKKVIATNNPNIDIPKVVDEVERLAKNYLKKCVKNLYGEGNMSTHPMYRNSLDVLNGVVEGYNKSQETHPFSEEDVRFMLSEAFKASQEGYQTTSDEILKLWKEQQPKIVYYVD